MKIIITLEDQTLKSGAMTVKAGVSIDPKPTPTDPETAASLLANKLWGVVMSEQERLARQPESGIVDATGTPIGFMQGKCQVCGKTFRRAFSSTVECQECQEKPPIGEQ